MSSGAAAVPRFRRRRLRVSAAWRQPLAIVGIVLAVSWIASAILAADSDVETFCALRLHIDSWRWAGVMPGAPYTPRQLPISTLMPCSLSVGTSGSTSTRFSLVVNLPGSVKAVEEGLGVLLPLIPHILDQLHGGDH